MNATGNAVSVDCCRRVPAHLAMVGVAIGLASLWISPQTLRAEDQGEITPLGLRPGEVLACSAEIDKNPGIVLVDSQGGLARLTDARNSCLWPAWSPDGQHLAFQSGRGMERNVKVMRRDGSEQRSVFQLSDGDGNPAWSPDGKLIAFAATPSDANADPDVESLGRQYLHLVKPDGQDLGLLEGPDGPIQGRDPTWGPDGELYFIRSQFNPDVDHVQSRICRVDLETQKTETIFTLDGAAVQLKASPDGKRLAFASNYGLRQNDLSNLHIFTIQNDGTDLQQLTTREGQNLGPDWSPDGKRIAFYGEIKNQNTGRLNSILHLFIMSADGSNLVELPGVGISAHGPAFCPIVEGE